VVDVSGFSVVHDGERGWPSQLAGQSNSGAEHGKHWQSGADNAAARPAERWSVCEHWQSGADNAATAEVRVRVVGVVCEHWEPSADNAAAAEVGVVRTVRS